jgi:L-histidine Nalpha-methyltransferase
MMNTNDPQQAPGEAHENENISALVEIISGLQRSEKMISPKYFYDERGSRLFDKITRLPEYYPTQTELGIMRENIAEISKLIGPQASLIEYGSGSSHKTGVLLEHLDDLAVYVPVDISEQHLLRSAARLRNAFPSLEILPVVGDFTKPIQLPEPTITPLRNIVYFPGSTIGNLTHDDAVDLLRVMYQVSGSNGAALIGVDLQKDPAVIERAYNDSAGVTAEFNLNILRHLNHVYGSDFDVEAFTHNAKYYDIAGRIELRLISSKAQLITIGDVKIPIAKGESILTEYSHKYTVSGFGNLAVKAGLVVRKFWTDSNQLFSVQFCTRT